MPDIFISYSSKNKVRVENLANALESEGLNVWRDRDVAPGEKFRTVIQEQLNQAKWVLVIWTEQSIDSDWVKQEATQAHERGVLIPVLIDNVTPPMPFGELQNANLKYWGEDRGNAEFQKLVSILKQEKTAPTSKHPRQQNVTAWLKNHWRQVSFGAVFFGTLALIGGYNDVMQLWKGLNTNSVTLKGKHFDPIKLDCSDSKAHASSITAPTFTASLDRASYKIGHTLEIQLKPDRYAYFTIIDHGSDPNTPERKKVLFINEDVQMNEAFVLPKPNTGIMKVSEPTGTNTFEVIASSEPISDPAASSKNVNFQAFSKTDTNQVPETNNCTLNFKITN